MVMSEPDHTQDILRSSMSVSDKIRALAAAGLPRAEIARTLGKRYQHVRNVLEADRQKQAAQAGVSEGERPAFERAPDDGRIGNSFRLRVEDGGRVRLPKAALEALKLKDGQVVVARLEGERLTLISAMEGLRRIWSLIPPWQPGEPLWSEELIAERRREAAREDEDG